LVELVGALIHAVSDGPVGRPAHKACCRRNLGRWPARRSGGRASGASREAWCWLLPPRYTAARPNCHLWQDAATGISQARLVQFQLPPFQVTLPACLPCEMIRSAGLRPCRTDSPTTWPAESCNIVSSVAGPMWPSPDRQSQSAIRRSAPSWPRAVGLLAKKQSQFPVVGYTQLFKGVAILGLTAVLPSKRFANQVI
jgi:hypothetical protein